MPTTKRPKPRSSSRKPTESMRAMIDGKKQDTVLLGDIKQHLVKVHQAEKGERRQDIIHPSEMSKADWCMRQTAYRLAETPPTDKPKEFFDQLLAIFSEGHGMHNWIQETLGDMGLLWGKWYCDSCSVSRTKVGSECPVCQSVMKYLEVPLQWPTSEIRLSGHADGAVLRDKAIVELKTIGLGTIRMEEPDLVKEFTDKQGVVDYDGLWKSIKRPLKSHRVQTTIYLAIAKRLGLDLDKVVFIYLNKATQAMKEFVITFNEDMAEELLDKAQQVTKAAATDPESIPRVTLTNKEGKTLPARKDRKPCTDCVFKTHCWRNDSVSTERAEERVSEDGSGEHGGEEETRSSTHRSRRSSEGRVSSTSRRTNRDQRQRSDESPQGDDGVGVVPGDSTSDRRDRRTPRSGVSRSTASDQDAVGRRRSRPQGRDGQEDRDRTEGEGVGGPGVRRRPRPRP